MERSPTRQTDECIYPLVLGNSGPLHDLPMPQVRITTCGLLSIAILKEVVSTDPLLGRYEILTLPRFSGHGQAKVLTFLKLLLSHPQRCASRDWLTDHLRRGGNGDEEGEEGAFQNTSYEPPLRLDKLASELRKLLCPDKNHPYYKELCAQLVWFRPGTSSGDGYGLAAYPLIWADTDAIAALVWQAARAEHEPTTALTRWERAYELASQGTYLLDEPYSDWAKARRREVTEHLGQCVHALARLYLAQPGEARREQALVVLRTYCQQVPTDEDALCVLMEVLATQQRYSEAWKYYQRLVDLLANEGKQPAMRTREKAQYVHLKLTQDEHTEYVPAKWAYNLGEEQAIAQRPPTLSIPAVSLMYSTSAPATLRASHEATSISDEAALFVSGVVSPSAIISHAKPFHTHIDSSGDLMQTRRQMLHTLLMIGSTALVLSPYAGFSYDESEQLNQSVLEELEIITASYWRLCTNTSLDLLGNLSEHFRTVVNLLQRILPRETAQHLCSLSGEIAQMLGKTLFDLHEYTLAWSYYMFSLKAAQIASNDDLWAVGIGRMILLLIYWETPQKALPLLQEVRQLTIKSPRIACWLALVEAEVHAHLGDEVACDASIQAAKHLSEHELLGEDRYATGFSPSRLAGYEGACFVRLRKPERALPALQRALALLDPHAIRRQSTIITDMGIAHAQQGNIQEACTLANQALTITVQTKSRAVLERVRTLHQELEPWKGTKEVKDLSRHLDKMAALIIA